MDQTLIFGLFLTFLHGGKSRNDTKPVLADRRDLRVSGDSAGCRESKNRNNFLKMFMFSIFRKNIYFKRKRYFFRI
jgi:hypothetical protein